MKISRIISLSGLALAILTAILLILIPIYSGVGVDPSTGLFTTKTTATLLQVNGYRALFPLAVPVVLAGAGMAAIWIRSPVLAWCAALLLLAFTVLTGFSIGLFYLPVTALTAVAAFLTQKAGRQNRPAV